MMIRKVCALSLVCHVFKNKINLFSFNQLCITVFQHSFNSLMNIKYGVWDVDIRRDDHINYNKYSLLLESQSIRAGDWLIDFYSISINPNWI
jgi:hypothetical protein